MRIGGKIFLGGVTPSVAGLTEGSILFQIVRGDVGDRPTFSDFSAATRRAMAMAENELCS